MDSEQCWERTHSWDDETPDPDWLKAIEEIKGKGRIPMEELRDELLEDIPKRRLELGGSEPIGKMSDLIPKRNRSKPDGFGKVSLGKSKR